MTPQEKGVTQSPEASGEREKVPSTVTFSNSQTDCACFVVIFYHYLLHFVWYMCSVSYFLYFKRMTFYDLSAA